MLIRTGCGDETYPLIRPGYLQRRLLGDDPSAIDGDPSSVGQSQSLQRPARQRMFGPPTWTHHPLPGSQDVRKLTSQRDSFDTHFELYQRLPHTPASHFCNLLQATK
jgi:hypothetical protein